MADLCQNNLRLLLIDDDSFLAEALRRQLRRTSYEINISLCVNEAIDLVNQSIQSQRPFTVIVSDLQMPTFNGVELCRKLKKTSPTTTFILLSGDTELSLVKEAQSESIFNHIIAKPCNAARLRKVVEKVAEKYLTNRQDN